MTQYNQVPWHNCALLVWATACLGLKGTAPRDPEHYTVQYWTASLASNNSRVSAECSTDRGKGIRGLLQGPFLHPKNSADYWGNHKKKLHRGYFWCILLYILRTQGNFKILFLTVTEILQHYDSTTPKLIKKTEETSVCEKKAIRRINQILCLVETRHRKSHLP